MEDSAVWKEKDACATEGTLREESKGGYSVPQFLSTHPGSAERIEDAKREIAALDLEGKELRTDDGGKLQIIQQRIELIIGTDTDAEGLYDDEVE